MFLYHDLSIEHSLSLASRVKVLIQYLVLSGVHMALSLLRGI